MKSLLMDKTYLDKFINLLDIYNKSEGEYNMFDIRDMDIRIIFIYLIGLCKNIKGLKEFADFNNISDLYRRFKETETKLIKLTERLSKKMKLECEKLDTYNLIGKCIDSVLKEKKYIDKLENEEKSSLEYLSKLVNLISNFPTTEFKEDKIFEFLTKFSKRLGDGEMIIDNKILYTSLKESTYDYTY